MGTLPQFWTWGSVPLTLLPLLGCLGIAGAWDDPVDMVIPNEDWKKPGMIYLIKEQEAFQREQDLAEQQAAEEEAERLFLVGKAKTFLHTKFTEIKTKAEQEAKQKKEEREKAKIEAQKRREEEQRFQEAAEVAREAKLEVIRKKRAEKRRQEKLKKMEEVQQQKKKEEQTLEYIHEKARVLREKADKLRQEKVQEAWNKDHYAKAPLGQDCPKGWKAVTDKERCRAAFKTLADKNEIEDLDIKNRVLHQSFPHGCFLNIQNRHTNFNPAQGQLNENAELYCLKEADVGASHEEMVEMHQAVQAAEAVRAFSLLNREAKANRSSPLWHPPAPRRPPSQTPSYTQGSAQGFRVTQPKLNLRASGRNALSSEEAEGNEMDTASQVHVAGYSAVTEAEVAEQQQMMVGPLRSLGGAELQKAAASLRDRPDTPETEALRRAVAQVYEEGKKRYKDKIMIDEIIHRAANRTDRPALRLAAAHL